MPQVEQNCEQRLPWTGRDELLLVRCFLRNLLLVGERPDERELVPTEPSSLTAKRGRPRLRLRIAGPRHRPASGSMRQLLPSCRLR